jgi:hypothetical protein
MKSQPGFDKAVILDEHPNVEKMSEVIFEFAAPLLEPLSDDDDNAFHNIIAVAVLCWNASMVSKHEREEMLSRFIAETATEGVLPAKEFREILDFMVQRKQRLFKNNKRWITNYEIKQTKKDREVYIVSTLEQRHIKTLMSAEKKPWWERLLFWRR